MGKEVNVTGGLVLVVVVFGNHGLDFGRFVAARGQEGDKFGTPFGVGFGTGVGIPLGFGDIDKDVAVFLVGDFGQGFGDEFGRNLLRAELVDDFKTAPFLVAKFGGDVGASVAAFVDITLVNQPVDDFG